MLARMRSISIASIRGTLEKPLMNTLSTSKHARFVDLPPANWPHRLGEDRCARSRVRESLIGVVEYRVWNFVRGCPGCLPPFLLLVFTPARSQSAT